MSSNGDFVRGRQEGSSEGQFDPFATLGLNPMELASARTPAERMAAMVTVEEAALSSLGIDLASLTSVTDEVERKRLVQAHVRLMMSSGDPLVREKAGRVFSSAMLIKGWLADEFGDGADDVQLLEQVLKEAPESAEQYQPYELDAIMRQHNRRLGLFATAFGYTMWAAAWAAWNAVAKGSPWLREDAMERMGTNGRVLVWLAGVAGLGFMLNGVLTVYSSVRRAPGNKGDQQQA